MAELNIDGKFVESDGRYVWVPNDSSKAKRPIVDDELIDWVIREEGFLTAPRDIGDGKMTIGSGLTDPKWHSLYKKRGNKWSEEDNRAAVREELEKRKKWAEDTVPNWDSLPEHSQKAMLSYKYNYNFTPTNSPFLFQAMTDGRFIDAMYQMDATSKNPKFKKGLQERRNREQQWGITELLEKPKKYIFEDRYAEEYPDRTNVVNTYTQGFNAVKPKPVTVPTSTNNYVEAVTLQNERPTLDAIDAIKALRSITEFNNSMKWENHPEGPKFVPVYDILDSYGDGGQFRKDWNSLSQAEKSDVMKLAVQNGITDLDTIKGAYNEFAKGGSIHIAPSKKGTFTAAASKHGKSVQEFASQVLAHPENYSPAMRKKANFARNASHWKHGLGGNLFDGTTEDSQQMNVLSTGNVNLYGFGDWLKKSITRAREVVHSLGLDKSPSQHILERIFSDDGKNNTEEKELSNTSIAASSKSGKRVAPVRQRPNASKTTPKESTILENMMRDYLIHKDKTVGTSNPEYDIPFISKKAVLINGSTTSTNVLDSLAKYAGIHNRSVQLSQHPIHEREYYTKRKLPRPVTMNEMLGLSTRETANGAMPAYNYAKNNKDKRKALNIDYKRYNNALGNANYFTAFGSIPAEYLVRNFHYDDTGVDRTIPPLLDAFRYYAQGDYNPGEPGHTANVEAYGEEAWRNPYVRKWWEKSGQYWYNGTKK